MKLCITLLIVFVLLVTASCATDGYRDDSRRYQFSPYSGYPADYWGNRSDQGVPLPGRQ